MDISLDVNELLIRIMKYLIEGILIVLVIYLLDMHKKLELMEIAILALTAASVFAIMDTLSNQTGSSMYKDSVRQGIGLSTGFRMMGAL
jgi:hypothetical protein